MKVKKQDNVFAGYMHLNEDLPSGNYQLRFYTSYMTNLSESYFFKRNIRIGNYMSVKYGIEPEFLVGKSDYKVSFFPEGGNLLFGTTNKIAFKALNSEGLREDISGVVVNASGDTLNTFRSTHLGMGIITMNISSREPLYAVCSNSDGLEKEFSCLQ